MTKTFKWIPLLVRRNYRKATSLSLAFPSVMHLQQKSMVLFHFILGASLLLLRKWNSTLLYLIIISLCLLVRSPHPSIQNRTENMAFLALPIPSRAYVQYFAVLVNYIQFPISASLRLLHHVCREIHSRWWTDIIHVSIYTTTGAVKMVLHRLTMNMMQWSKKMRETETELGTGMRNVGLDIIPLPSFLLYLLFIYRVCRLWNTI